MSAAERGDEADGGQVRGHRAARPRRVGPAVTLWCKHSAPPCPSPPTPAGGARPLRPARPAARATHAACALRACPGGRRAGARAAPAVTRGDPRSLPPLPLQQSAGPPRGPEGRRSGGWSGSARPQVCHVAPSRPEAGRAGPRLTDAPGAGPWRPGLRPTSRASATTRFRPHGARAEAGPARGHCRSQWRPVPAQTRGEVRGGEGMAEPSSDDAAGSICVAPALSPGPSSLMEGGGEM